MGETELPALEMPVSKGCGILVCSARTWEELDLEDEESPLEGVTTLAKGPKRISKKQAQRTCLASCDPKVGIKLTVLPFTLLSLGVAPALMHSRA